MLESIKEIGIFMVAAQAVIHFAPGRQYEKYIKLISGVIILFLFIRPFLSAQGEWEQEWQTKTEQIMQKYEEEDLWQETDRHVEDMAVEQLEIEIKSRLNQAIAEEEYYVDSVSLDFGKVIISPTGSEENVPKIQKVDVVMTSKGEDAITSVIVEDIVVGEVSGQENAEKALRYQEIFAEMLGIEPEGVEVTCVGGW